MDKLNLFTENKFVYFSHNIECYKNAKNEIKKKPIYKCQWSKILKPEESYHNINDSIISIKTGLISGLFVIDIDDLNNEISKDLNKLCLKYCKWKVSTRKGYHYYFIVFTNKNN